MKRFFMVIIASVIAVTAFGQAQINTKKVKIEDFMEKTMKVVTTGNMFFDQSLKDEVSSRWRISPFEFCTLDEFNRLKADENYYFMLVTYGRFRKEAEPGLAYLTVIKGGKGAEKGIGKMLEVVSAPIMSAKNPNGRELIFLPSILDILQDHIANSMEKDVDGYGGLANYTMHISGIEGKEILFADEDLSSEITEDLIVRYFKDGMRVVDVDEADEVMVEGRPDTVVSFTVAPDEAGPGSYCYKMLFDARTHELYYFRKHRISNRVGTGFLLEDISKIVTSR